jgi:hypothetical protein
VISSEAAQIERFRYTIPGVTGSPSVDGTLLAEALKLPVVRRRCQWKPICRRKVTPPLPHYAHLHRLMQPLGHLVSQKSTLHAVEVSTEAARTKSTAVTSRINLRFIFFPFRLR